MSYPSALYFHELDEQNPALIDNLIAINVNATTQVCRRVWSNVLRVVAVCVLVLWLCVCL
jgi:hypothetical protein